jgi:hypothetical protein
MVKETSHRLRSINIHDIIMTHVLLSSYKITPSCRKLIKHNMNFLNINSWKTQEVHVAQFLRQRWLFLWLNIEWGNGSKSCKKCQNSCAHWRTTRFQIIDLVHGIHEGKICNCTAALLPISVLEFNQLSVTLSFKFQLLPKTAPLKFFYHKRTVNWGRHGGVKPILRAHARTHTQNALPDLKPCVSKGPFSFPYFLC